MADPNEEEVEFEFGVPVDTTRSKGEGEDVADESTDPYKREIREAQSDYEAEQRMLSGSGNDAGERFASLVRRASRGRRA